MLDKLDMKPVTTALMVLLALIVVGAGAVVTVTNPDTYPFRAYLDDLKTFAVGVGALGIGRGILSGLSNLGIGVHLPSERPEVSTDLGQTEGSSAGTMVEMDEKPPDPGNRGVPG